MHMNVPLHENRRTFRKLSVGARYPCSAQSCVLRTQTRSSGVTVTSTTRLPRYWSPFRCFQRRAEGSRSRTRLFSGPPAFVSWKQVGPLAPFHRSHRMVRITSDLLSLENSRGRGTTFLRFTFFPWGSVTGWILGISELWSLIYSVFLQANVQPEQLTYI